MRLLKSCIPAVLLLAATHLFADRYDQAKSKNAGNYLDTETVTVSSFTPTKVIDETLSIQAASVDVFVNSQYTVWTGTQTTTLSSTGFPITSSAPFTTDGVYTGSMYGLADPAAGGSVNVRVRYWMKNDYAN